MPGSEKEENCRALSNSIFRPSSPFSPLKHFLPVDFPYRSNKVISNRTLSPFRIFGKSLTCQSTDSCRYALSDRIWVVPHGRECGRKTRCRDEPSAVLGLQEPALVEHSLPAGLDKRIFEQRVEQDNYMPQVVHPDMKTLLAGKESFHILHARGKTKQMVSIGTRHNTCHLFMGHVATERKWRGFRQFIDVIPAGYRQRFGRVVHPFQHHALLERK